VKKSSIIIAAIAAAALTGCTGQTAPIGLIDVQRLAANWPQYQTVQNQLLADEQGIERGKGSQQQKQQQVAQLQAKYSKLSQQLVGQIRDAATKVAQQKNLKLVVTKEFVTYGGTDITPDVEKAMGITETASPAPSSSP
jgi:Skp family chaperone for outer membrane proteins